MCGFEIGDGAARELRRDELLMLLEGVRLAGVTRKTRYRVRA